MRNKKVINDKQYRYSIRKLNVGVVSVAVSALMFLGGLAALADQNSTDTTTSETELVDTSTTDQTTQAETDTPEATSTQEDNESAAAGATT